MAVARRCDFRTVRHPKRPSAAVVLANYNRSSNRQGVQPSASLLPEGPSPETKADGKPPSASLVIESKRFDSKAPQLSPNGLLTFYEYLLMALVAIAVSGCTITSLIAGIVSGCKHRPAHRSLPWTILRTAAIGLGIGVTANAICVLAGYYYINNVWAPAVGGSHEAAIFRFLAIIVVLIPGLNIGSPIVAWRLCRKYLSQQSFPTESESP